jgi:hypothetical protein
MTRIVERVTAAGRNWERCSGCNGLVPRGQALSAIAGDDHDIIGWFCDACIKRWSATGTILLWGLCAGCGQKRALSAVDIGDWEGPAWLCEECRKKHQRG